MGHPVPGGYKYGNLALQVRGVSNETVKYGFGFCGTWTRARLLWQGPEAIVRVNYGPILSSERMLNIKKLTIVRKEKKILVISSRQDIIILYFSILLHCIVQ
jgi:hypothetical protein